MKTLTTKKSAMELLLNLYDYHTKWFINSLADISDEDSQNRLNTKANHIGWIAGSLVYQRQVLANALGIDVKQTSEKLFNAGKGGGHKGIQDNVTYPSLSEYKQDWEKISTPLRKSLMNITDEQLNAPDPFEMPEDNYTFFETLTFGIDRESYCIGQIGLFRRLLGYEAMKYE